MILYLDNIRGFQDQFIELNDVNFLVGENSTGKTTVMSILSLLSDEKFNYSEFKNEFVNLGPFSEIITQNSPNQDSFTIGIIYQENKAFRVNFDAASLIFKNSKEGFPYCTSALFVHDEVLFEYMNPDNEKVDIVLFLKKTKPKLSKLKSIVRNKGKALKDWEKQNETFNNYSFKSRSPFLNIGRIYEDSDFYELLTKTSKIRPKLRFHNYNAFKNDTVWFSPIRSEPLRIYEPKPMVYSAGGEHIPTLLRTIYANKDTNKTLIDSIENFGKSSGLFNEIIIENYRDAFQSAFEIHFMLNGRELKITNVGYGISQILPIVVEVCIRLPSSVFLIQQSEIHLHPKAQAFLGQFFFDQAFENNKKFVIETHSDFIIDRFRLMIRKSKKKDVHKRVNILFFETTEEGNKVTKIELDKNGDYMENQPEKFRDFFVKEQFKLLGFEDND